MNAGRVTGRTVMTIWRGAEYGPIELYCEELLSSILVEAGERIRASVRQIELWTIISMIVL